MSLCQSCGLRNSMGSCLWISYGSLILKAGVHFTLWHLQYELSVFHYVRRRLHSIHQLAHSALAHSRASLFLIHYWSVVVQNSCPLLHYSAIIPSNYAFLLSIITLGRTFILHEGTFILWFPTKSKFHSLPRIQHYSVAICTGRGIALEWDLVVDPALISCMHRFIGQYQQVQELMFSFS